ncbi:MAG: hypothetical protein SWQ30_02305 [Thermodesulfobacteriota bacterium]|nr:hypothetical protein [Thermodesulfobacteriota bacterium]
MSPKSLVSAKELVAIMETAHLLRSPKNTKRLLTALAQAKEKEMGPSSVEELRKELGLEKA